MLTRAEITETVSILSDEFGVPAPLIVITKEKGHGAFYRSITESIHIGLGNQAWAILHEFAHHLCHMERIQSHGPHNRFHRSSSGKRLSHHGKAFAECLYRIAVAWYGDPLKYPWDKEYRSLRKYGETRKLTRAKNGAGPKRAIIIAGINSEGKYYRRIEYRSI